MVPGIFDSSVDGKAEGAIEFVVSHFVSVSCDSGTARGQWKIIRMTEVRTPERGTGLKSCEY